MKYKFRAECLQDAEQFRDANSEVVSNCEITKLDGFPDVEVTFDTPLQLEQIIDLMKVLHDAHVMYQTVKHFNDYTGERTYEF